MNLNVDLAVAVAVAVLVDGGGAVNLIYPYHKNGQSVCAAAKGAAGSNVVHAFIRQGARAAELGCSEWSTKTRLCKSTNMKKFIVE